ncbi:uncharacterized protein LOC126902229 [Daktulosphaira vitifoliae]|uniref:uncharacterized protein LOC126902229 n=1 Tax=Daktulosphaira vitifoliae TaxID=58002 RepID=UPI0021A999D5|nr:uncharacterized protein LOC126902229 [Daktulosphaira vitifoliae]
MFNTKMSLIKLLVCLVSIINLSSCLKCYICEIENCGDPFEKESGKLMECRIFNNIISKNNQTENTANETMTNLLLQNNTNQTPIDGITLDWSCIKSVHMDNDQEVVTRGCIIRDMQYCKILEELDKLLKTCTTCYDDGCNAAQYLGLSRFVLIISISAVSLFYWFH